MKLGYLAALWLGIFSIGPVQADLTVDAVIEMSRQGEPRDRILERIASEPRTFELTPQQIIRMREAGVDPDVIVAMIEHKPAAPATPVAPPAPEAEAPRPGSPGEEEPPASSSAERLRIENRSEEPVHITRGPGTVVLSPVSGDHRLSPRHYYLLEAQAGASSLVVEASGESRTLRVLSGTQTRILYYGPRRYLIAEGLSLDSCQRTIRGLVPEADLTGLTASDFADRIVVVTEDGIQEYREDWVAFSSRKRAEDRYDAYDYACPPDEHAVHEDWPEDHPGYSTPYEPPYYAPPDQYPRWTSRYGHCR